MSMTLRCGRGICRTDWPLLLVVLAAVFARPCLSARAATKAKAEQAIAELVDEALFGEIYARDRERIQLLEEALKQSPDFARARWHTGHVRLAGKWVHIDDVPTLTQSNQSYQEYLRVRMQYPDTVRGQTRLGVLCRRLRLLEQARTHFLRVLDLFPDHAEARKYLGY